MSQKMGGYVETILADLCCHSENGIETKEKLKQE